MTIPLPFATLVFKGGCVRQEIWIESTAPPDRQAGLRQRPGQGICFAHNSFVCRYTLLYIHILIFMYICMQRYRCTFLGGLDGPNLYRQRLLL